MKILVLEDNRERINIFRNNLQTDGVSLTFAITVPACVQALELEEYDYLFLDHDLGGKVYVPSDGDEETGWHVAKWLSEHPDRMPPQIFIHSLNENGRKNMMSLLPDATELPFAWQLVKIREAKPIQDN